MDIKHYHFDVVNSTQDTARELFSQNTQVPFLVTADTQTGGRGRLGRPWISSRGNFFGSLIVVTDMNPARYGEYSFLTAVVLRETIAKFSSEKIMLKWPNDVLSGGKKCAGILIEAEQDYLIIGIGVNLLHAPPPDAIGYPAAALGIMNKAQFTSELIAQWMQWYDKYRRHDFDFVRTEWLRHAHAIGGKVTVQMPHKKLDGIFAGLDGQGNLLLTQGAETIKVTTADVFIS